MQSSVQPSGALTIHFDTVCLPVYTNSNDLSVRWLRAGCKSVVSRQCCCSVLRIDKLFNGTNNSGTQTSNECDPPKCDSATGSLNGIRWFRCIKIIQLFLLVALQSESEVGHKRSLDWILPGNNRPIRTAMATAECQMIVFWFCFWLSPAPIDRKCIWRPSFPHRRYVKKEHRNGLQCSIVTEQPKHAFLLVPPLQSCSVREANAQTWFVCLSCGSGVAFSWLDQLCPRQMGPLHSNVVRSSVSATLVQRANTFVIDLRLSQLLRSRQLPVQWLRSEAFSRNLPLFGAIDLFRYTCTWTVFFLCSIRRTVSCFRYIRVCVCTVRSFHCCHWGDLSWYVPHAGNWSASSCDTCSNARCTLANHDGYLYQQHNWHRDVCCLHNYSYGQLPACRLVCFSYLF